MNKNRDKGNDILTGDMARVFKACENVGEERVLIYLEEFSNPSTMQQASFKRDDISIMKVWMEGQKIKKRKKDKFEERMWNLCFLLIGAAISALVAWGTTTMQLAIAVDPIIEVVPSDTVIGKKGEFDFLF